VIGGDVLDCKIVGGEVVDGTGAPRRRADVGIADGRVVVVGTDLGAARRTIDAEGRVVAPGFIDSHTHHDAQLAWDPAATPSPLHGVTTSIGGNCGFTIAPLEPGEGDYLRRMLARVEGMPLESLEAGLTWDWRSFGEWLGTMEGRIALNAGFLVGHSTLRRLAMGADAVGESADERRLARMVAYLHEALAEGGLGLSSSLGASHSDGDGNPVPSRAASTDELIALARGARDHPGTTLGLNPGAGPFRDDVLDLMSDMSLAADRPLNWNALLVHTGRAEAVHRELAASDHARARGGHVVAQVVLDPRRFYVSFVNGFLLDALPGWAPLFGLPVAERVRRLTEPAERDRLRAGVESDEVPAMLRAYTDPAAMTIVDAGEARAADLAGRVIGDLAAERGTDPFDLWLDVAVASDLRAVFMPVPVGDDEASWQLRRDAWLDPRTVIGAADAGAHLDVASSFTYTTSLLGGAVRERGLLSLEAAIRELTDVPARLLGLDGRGRVAEGMVADLVVFDEHTVAPREVHMRADLPGGARRLYAEADGIDHVLVGGACVVEAGSLTGACPGVVLRSGRDTSTVTVAAANALASGSGAAQ
jgi:N-acyl-D-aspartate/D-glutamate deacylase